MVCLASCMMSALNAQSDKLVVSGVVTETAG